MTSRLGSFGDFGGRIWLNCAHQGPLPLPAAEEAREAVAWKTSPHELTAERFSAVPERMRTALGALIGAPAEEIILANGASYGLHLWANGLGLGAGDEILLMRGDFPSNILPWLGLEKHGVRVRQITPEGFVLGAVEIEPHVTNRTRAVCLSWVHSFSGHVADLEAIGSLCRSRGVLFLVNTTQGLGARRLDVGRVPVDGITNAGWKWLCGPYGTGFCWLHPEVRERLDYNQAYWLSMQTADDLGREDAEPQLVEGLGARRYDVFSTANFFNFKPWSAAVEHLMDIGLDRIAERDRALVARLLTGLDEESYELVSRDVDTDPSTLIFLSHRLPDRNQRIYDAIGQSGVDIAYRRGRLRVAPHFFNTEGEIDRVLAVLQAAR